MSCEKCQTPADDATPEEVQAWARQFPPIPIGRWSAIQLGYVCDCYPRRTLPRKYTTLEVPGQRDENGDWIE